MRPTVPGVRPDLTGYCNDCSAFHGLLGLPLFLNCRVPVFIGAPTTEALKRRSLVTCHMPIFQSSILTILCNLPLIIFTLCIYVLPSSSAPTSLFFFCYPVIITVVTTALSKSWVESPGLFCQMPYSLLDLK